MASTYRYTDEQKAQSLILLAANRGDVNLTSSQTGISPHALQRWVAQEQRLPSPDIGKGMEHAIHYLMGRIPDLVNKYNISELLGTLLEKWLQYQGVPQNSTQTVLAVLATKSEADLDRMIRDIDTGRHLALTGGNDQIIALEEQLAHAGLSGLAERDVDPALVGKSNLPDIPTEIVDLIEYNSNQEYALSDSDVPGGSDEADDQDGW